MKHKDDRDCDFATGTGSMIQRWSRTYGRQLIESYTKTIRPFLASTYLQPYSCNLQPKKAKPGISCQAKNQAPGRVYHSNITDGSMNHVALSEVAALLISGIYGAAFC